jgi:hypothetical protein
MLGIEPLTSPMINQVLNQWTTPSKGVQLLLIFLFHMCSLTLHYKIMRYEGRYVIGDRLVGG